MLAYILTLLAMLAPRTALEDQRVIAERIAAYADDEDAARVLVVLRVHEDGAHVRTRRPYGLPRRRSRHRTDEDLAYSSWLHGLATCHTEAGAFRRYQSGGCRGGDRVTRTYVLITARSLRRARQLEPATEI